MSTTMTLNEKTTDRCKIQGKIESDQCQVISSNFDEEYGSGVIQKQG